MDEVLFRSSRKLENLQVQLSLAATQSKDILKQYSEQGRTVVLQVWNGSHSERLKHTIQTLWNYLVDLSIKTKQQLWLYVDPQKLYYNLAKVFWQKWTKRDVCFFCAGFIFGGIVGVVFISWRKKHTLIHHMQAIQCTNYLGTESATVIQNARAPSECSNDEVIVNVKAASVHVIDAQICNGYGKTLRPILQKLYNKKASKSDLPVTLGRDCAGVITDVGANVRRLELGDEVWMTVPFWHEGTLSQSVILSEFRVSRKPKNVGYEGATSLPYAGTLALDVLRELQITQSNSKNKKFLVVGACTPVGCVLIQILKYWGCRITATCPKRATPVGKALGVQDIINFPKTTDSLNWLKKELELREKFDFVVVTSHGVDVKDLEDFVCGRVVSTLPKVLFSDSCNFFERFFLKGAIYFKFILEKIGRVSLNDYDEGHMCFTVLDELTEMVENGQIQTVVEKVLHPEDIEIGLNHIQSVDSIGSTVITFR